MAEVRMRVASPTSHYQAETFVSPPEYIIEIYRGHARDGYGNWFVAAVTYDRTHADSILAQLSHQLRSVKR